MLWCRHSSLLLVVAAALTAHVTNGLDQVLNIFGSGTTNPSVCLWEIIDDFTRQVKIPILMSYRAVGSGVGQQEFIANNSATPANYFGSGDIPINSTQYEGLSNAGIGIVHLPILLGAVSFFHSVPDTPNLNLTSCLLARIFLRNITDWNDEDIKAENPNLKLPSSTYPITVARRVLGSSSTATITAYLRDDCPQHFPAVMAQLNPPPWPTDTIGCDGSAQMTTCILDTPGTIGYIDTGHGLGAELQEVAMKNKDGYYLSSTLASSKGGILAAEEGSFPNTADADFGGVSFVNKPGRYTWPLVQMTYLYVRKDLSFIKNPQEQSLLIAFLKALYDPDYVGQCQSDAGFISPSNSTIALGLAGIQMVEDNISENATAWTYEKKDTLPIVGMGPYVISSKRNTNDKVERDDLYDQIADAVTLIQQLQSELKAAKAEIVNLKTILGVSGGSGSALEAAQLSDFTDQDEKQLKAALVLSCLSFVFWMVFLIYQAVWWTKKP